jgi:hypothetical protein
MVGHHVFAEAVPLYGRPESVIDLKQLLEGVIVGLSGDGQRDGSCHDGEIEEVRTRYMERRPGVAQEIAALDSIGRGRESDSPCRIVREVIDIRGLGYIIPADGGQDAVAFAGDDLPKS